LESHYNALGVARSADGGIIRAAYRVLAKRYHPDTATGPQEIAAARFRRIQEAYEVLSDARRQAEYDAQLDASTTKPQAPQASPRPTSGPPRAPEAEMQPHRAAPEREPSPRSGARENAWPIAGVLIIGPYFIPSWLTPFSAHSWPAIQTLISLAIGGVSLVKLLPKFGRDSSIAEIYWRGVGYLLIALVLGIVLELLGGSVVEMLGGFAALREAAPVPSGRFWGCKLVAEQSGRV
jgi:hypothetical protein